MAAVTAEFETGSHVYNSTEMASLLDALNHLLSTHRDNKWDAVGDRHWRVLIVTLYCVILTLGAVENAFIVLVVIKRRVMRTNTNLFIANLAVADIWLCCFNIPLQLHYQLTFNWAFGAALCKIVFPLFAVPVYASSLTMLLIATDRYLLIIYPHKSRMCQTTALACMGAIYLFPILLTIPLILTTQVTALTEDPELAKLTNHIEPPRYYCAEMWTSDRVRDAYSIFLCIIHFVVPITITSGFYTRICTSLRNRQRRLKSTKRKRRTTYILGTIVLVFSACWLPWHLFSLLVELKPNIVPLRYLTLIDLLLKWFATCSTVANPLLYGWLNVNFRLELSGLLRLYACCSKTCPKPGAAAFRTALPDDETTRAPTRIGAAGRCGEGLLPIDVEFQRVCSARSDECKASNDKLENS